MVVKKNAQKQINCQLSDEDLVTRYKVNNKQKIIGELWNRYSLMVFGVCLKYMGNKEVAEDTTLAVFESLFEKLKPMM